MSELSFALISAPAIDSRLLYPRSFYCVSHFRQPSHDKDATLVLLQSTVSFLETKSWGGIIISKWLSATWPPSFTCSRSALRCWSPLPRCRQAGNTVSGSAMIFHWRYKLSRTSLPCCHTAGSSTAPTQQPEPSCFIHYPSSPI